MWRLKRMAKEKFDKEYKPGREYQVGEARGHG
jgi:hypothetical protein